MPCVEPSLLIDLQNFEPFAQPGQLGYLPMTLAGPYLDELSALTGDTIHMAIREGDEVLHLSQTTGRNGLEMR